MPRIHLDLHKTDPRRHPSSLAPAGHSLLRWIPAVALLPMTIAAARGQNPDTGQHWIATWGTAEQTARIGAGIGRPAIPVPVFSAPSQPSPAPVAPPAQTGPARRFGIPRGVSTVENQTLRMVLRVSVGGVSVRVRFSNAFGATAVPIGAAHIALRGAESSIVPGSDRVLTFGGQPTALMYAGETVVSEPVNLKIPALADVVVSIYIPTDVAAPTSHLFGLRPTYASKPGDFTGADSISEIATTAQSYYWLAGVDVLAPEGAGTLVTFGDSITDGDQSTPDTNGMWPAVLAARLQGDKQTKRVAVVNAGISGNRVLGDNNGGLARFNRDALSVPGVRWITILEGINDISAATRNSQIEGRGPAPAGTAAQPPFSAQTLIAAYRQMIELAHLHNVKVIGCTITPFGGSSAFTARGESIRDEVNDWIRKGHAFDAVVDFDAATRDLADPHKFRAEADSPDMLHPGDAGYKAIAEAFDLSIFTEKTPPGGGSKTSRKK